MKRRATDWEEICEKYISDKGLVYRIYKDPSKVNNKKTTIPRKKEWANYFNDTSSGKREGWQVSPRKDAEYR